MKKSLKIFLSSTMKDLGPEREIAARAVEALHLEALRAETFGARPGTPADVCMEMVRECDVFIGIYGGRYGYAPQGQSPSVTELEFLEARQRAKDILVYVKDEADRDPLQADFLRRADDFEGGYFRRPAFRTITELEEWIKEDLIALLSSRFVTKHQPEEETVEDAYRSYVRALYGKMSFAGLAQSSSGLEVALDEIFVSPRVRSITQDDSKPPKSVDVSEALQKNQRSLIVGSPGSGKTVLLKSLAIQAARDDRLGHGNLLPILVPLASWAGTVDRGSPMDDLAQHIAQFISSRAEPRFTPAIQDALDTGHALVLLDGLDEVEREDLRTAIGNGVGAFWNRYPNVRVVLTTRPTATIQIPGFASFELLPWTDHQVSRFVHHWSAALNDALGLSVDSDTQANQIMRAIASHSGLRELARNPLFLTLLAFVHRQAYRLPSRRVELYDAFVGTMLGSWERARSLSHTLPRKFELAAVERILSSLALEMSKRDIGTIGIDAAAAIARTSMSPDKSEDAEFSELLSELASQSAILAQRGMGEFSFAHLTFQEFFAAKAVAAMGDQEAIEFITSNYFEPRFEETIRLALSWMDVHGGRRGLVGRAVEELLSAARA
jgi:hypothetical protein